MEEWKILKTLSGSSPIFALSFHTTFSQTQTGATVPLKKHLKLCKERMLMYNVQLYMEWRPELFYISRHSPTSASQQCASDHLQLMDQNKYLAVAQLLFFFYMNVIAQTNSSVCVCLLLCGPM